MNRVRGEPLYSGAIIDVRLLWACSEAAGGMEFAESMRRRLSARENLIRFDRPHFQLHPFRMLWHLVSTSHSRPPAKMIAPSENVVLARSENVLSVASASAGVQGVLSVAFWPSDHPQTNPGGMNTSVTNKLKPPIMNTYIKIPGGRALRALRGKSAALWECT